MEHIAKYTTHINTIISVTCDMLQKTLIFYSTDPKMFNQTVKCLTKLVKTDDNCIIIKNDDDCNYNYNYQKRMIIVFIIITITITIIIIITIT